MAPDPGTITRLLTEARDGRPRALDDLFELLYDDLRAVARRELGKAHNSPVHATTLVHSACARLLGRDALDAADRRHFFFLLGRAMHDVLVEGVREERSQKRGGGWRRQTLVEFECDDRAVVADALDLAEALGALERVDPESHRVVMLRCFGGRTLREAAELMECTFATARGHWDYARAWLRERLGEGFAERDA